MEHSTKREEEHGRSASTPASKHAPLHHAVVVTIDADVDLRDLAVRELENHAAEHVLELFGVELPRVVLIWREGRAKGSKAKELVSSPSAGEARSQSAGRRPAFLNFSLKYSVIGGGTTSGFSWAFFLPILRPGERCLFFVPFCRKA